MKKLLLFILICYSLNSYAQLRVIKSNTQGACNSENIYLITTGSEAKFPGGMTAFYKALSEEIQLQKSITQKAFYSVIINCKGELTGGDILSGVNREVDKQIIEALKKVKGWTPATQENGEKVDMRKSISLKIKKGKIVF